LRAVVVTTYQVVGAHRYQPLISLDQAGRLENAAYMQWVAHYSQG